MNISIPSVDPTMCQSVSPRRLDEFALDRFNTIQDYHRRSIQDCHQRSITAMKSRISEVNLHNEELRTQHDFITEIRREKNDKIRKLQQAYDDLNTEYDSIEFEARIKYQAAQRNLELLCCHVQPKHISNTDLSCRPAYMVCDLCQTQVRVTYCASAHIKNAEKTYIVFPYFGHTPYITVEDLGPEFGGIVPRLNAV